MGNGETIIIKLITFTFVYVRFVFWHMHYYTYLVSFSLYMCVHVLCTCVCLCLCMCVCVCVYVCVCMCVCKKVLELYSAVLCNLMNHLLDQWCLLHIIFTFLYSNSLLGYTYCDETCG